MNKILLAIGAAIAIRALVKTNWTHTEAYVDDDGESIANCGTVLWDDEFEKGGQVNCPFCIVIAGRSA